MNNALPVKLFGSCFDATKIPPQFDVSKYNVSEKKYDIKLNLVLILVK